MKPPKIPNFSYQLESEALRVGSEIRWKVRLHDGQPAELGMLALELNRDESLRRRYLRDLSHWKNIENKLVGDTPPLARTLAIGESSQSPNSQTTDQTKEQLSPWRLRESPTGQTLESWISEFAPASPDRVCEVFEPIAEALGQIHQAGAVIRELHPKSILLGPPVRFLVAGLSRVDLLSTRSASSLILEGSAYHAPELVTRTAVDQRSDFYSFGVILFRALTGEFPFEESFTFLRDSTAPPPDLQKIRPDIPSSLAHLVQSCLDSDPEKRPESTRSIVATLKGQPSPQRSLARIECQSCHGRLRPGQRLCTRCGQLAVQFAQPEEAGDYDVVLRRITEEAETLEKLSDLLSRLSSFKPKKLNFLGQHHGMYSKREQKEGIRLPAILFSELDKKNAETIASLFEQEGFKVAVQKNNQLVSPKMKTTGALVGGAMALVASVFAFAVEATAVEIAIGGAILSSLYLGVFFSVAAIRRAVTKKRKALKAPLGELRKAPVALPASDPFVQRLTQLLNPDGQTSIAEDLREQVGELALCIQRWVDHRIQQSGQQSEIDLQKGPIGQAVSLIEKQVLAISKIDHELTQLDEGQLAREFAAVQARAELAKKSADKEQSKAQEHEVELPPILDQLDRLRNLEEARAQAFSRLLEAGTLLRQATQQGLAIHDPEKQHELHVRLALEVLGVE